MVGDGWATEHTQKKEEGESTSSLRLTKAQPPLNFYFLKDPPLNTILLEIEFPIHELWKTHSNHSCTR
jgi:hypothetical protein